MSVSEKLFSFVCDTDYRHLPKEAINRAKHCFLDGLGVMVAGSVHPASNIVLDYARSLGGKTDATALGSGFQTSLPLAALINGTQGHILDFDDTNFEFEGHPTTVLLSAILATGEKMGASGQEALASYILGFEAACKIGRGVNPGHYRRGYHATSTIGVFGATIAAGKIMRLSPKELGHAFGIAGSRSAGLRANFGTMTKSLHAGLAAHDGLMSALLGKLGYTANPRILETEWGFGQVMSPTADFRNPFENLGDPLDILSSGVAVKKYPSGALTHPAVDAALGLIQENHIDPSKIKKIRCGTNDEIIKVLIHPWPQIGLEGKFSIPYCLARSCLDGKLEINDFTDERVRDPLVQALMKKITNYVDPEIVQKGYKFKAPAKVTIEMENGQIFEKTAERAKGDPDDPLSFEELAQKFRNCARGILNDSQREKAIQMVAGMENISNISEVIQLLISNR